MAVSFNKVIIAGSLTRDPEVRFLANDKQVAGFGIAINHSYKGADGEKKEDTTFVDVECWGRTAELVGQYCTKGKPVLIEGRLKMDTWDDKATGQKRSKLKVVADDVRFLGDGGGKREEGEAPRPARAAEPRRPAARDTQDDPTPF